MNKISMRNLLLVVVLFLSGCQAEKENPTGSTDQYQEISQEDILSGITVEGRLVPKGKIALAFSVTGQIGEVLVQEGEMVQPGQVIARLADRQTAEASVRAAELEKIIAQQALDALNENHDELVNQALLAVRVGRQSVDDAQRYLDSITGYPLQNEIAGAKAQQTLAEDALNSAREAYEDYQDREDADKTRANARVALTEAQRVYNQAVQHLDDLQGEGYNFILIQAQTAFDIAKQQLVLAENRYNEALKGPDPDAIAVAEARLSAADANLTSAQSYFSQTELRAPMAGKLVESILQTGQLVTPNLPVGELVDFSEWQVETEDLSEVDVVNIRVGQDVAVVADALPNVKMMGKVVTIRDSFQQVRGEITYVTRIKIEEINPRLRWGMTVMVTFLEP